MRKITSDFIGEVILSGFWCGPWVQGTTQQNSVNPKGREKNIREQNTTSEFSVFWPQLTLLTFVHYVTYRE